MAYSVPFAGTVFPTKEDFPMPFASRRPKLELSDDTILELRRISDARSESASRVERATILLAYHAGKSVSAIARQLRTDRPKIERSIDKALSLGAMAALDDLPGRGRPANLTAEAKAWVISLACQKPKELGYSYELWTTHLLAEHVRTNCLSHGHPSLGKLSRGTVSKILAAHTLKPHKVRYYLEQRDPDFDRKMAQVLLVYKEVELLRQAVPPHEMLAVLSYDEKTGIQAIANTSADLPPVASEHAQWARDNEYVRHGTLSLLAGLDLLNGEVLGLVRERHRSTEFIEFLELADAHYPTNIKIRIILDNHSSHISQQTREYLATKPNRFEFVFTPKHGSWLNIIEGFFAKMARTLLRHIRVASKEELKNRIELFLNEVNQMPVVFRWKYKLDTIDVV
jgi:transposase